MSPKIKNIAIAVFVLLVLLVSFFVFQRWSQDKLLNGPVSSDGTPAVPYANALIKNEQFRVAEQLYADQKYDEAEKAYMNVLNGTTSLTDTESGSVHLYLGWTQGLNKKYEPAIKELKGVASNEAYSSWARASAIEAMGLLAYRYKEDAPQIGKLIFSDEPYKDFLTDGKVTSKSYRMLYEYALAKNDLMLASVHVARWYAKEGIDPSDPTSAVSAEAVQQAVKSLAIGDRAMRARTGAPQRANSQMQEYRLQKAFLASELNKNGVTALGDPAPYFLSAIGSATNVAEKARFSYFYAIELSQQNGGKGREQAIRGALSEVYNNADKINKTALVRSFAGEKRNLIGQKKQLVILASIDPKFKAYLITLGWENADFR